ncbi:MAG: polysaccharide deacetylase family protein [Victivallales bacterium]|nr:polysaccharide deacetylase family protein [Victivallales bacterium]
MDIIKLWPDCETASTLIPYLLRDNKLRPAVLVIPGGGYGCVCGSTEGEPVARRFNELGFQAFVLNYRVAPHRFPVPQQDAMRAMKVIRYYAESWRVKADNIAVCGFSAGAHLAACLGTIAREIKSDRHDEIDDCEYRPDALLLGYGVLSFARWSHQGTINNLSGEQLEALCRKCSLEKQIQADTPPAYVWHTASDQAVSRLNSIAFATAMWRGRRQCELHVFPDGPHGMQLGYGREDIAGWPEEAKAFLHGTCGFRFPDSIRKRTVVLTFDDAVKSHFTNVAPLLKKYGFGASFFICRFNEAWRAQHAAQLLSPDEIRQLSDMGFEIGNHTVTHPDLRKCSADECRKEVAGMNDFLQSCGVKAPVSFAYPRGPFAENAVPVLQDNGMELCRTTERRAWRPQHDSCLRIPAFSLGHDDELAFYQTLAHCREDNAVVLVFHGVPDLVHDSVSTSLPFFAKCMKYLYDNDFRVVGLQRCFKDFSVT